MMRINKGVQVNLLRIEGKKRIRSSDLVARETELTIFANKKRIITLNCSPGHYRYLGVGFLFTAGMINKKEDIFSMKTNRKSISIEMKDLSLPENGAVVSSSHWLEIQQPSLLRSKTISVKDKKVGIRSCTIYSLMTDMQEKAVFFKQSGGVHSCALSESDGSIILFCEDISRYNTIDRILGEALLKNISIIDKVMLTSCRITSGIMKKIVMSHISIIISRSAPTDAAIRLAHQKGITLVGFVRGERMNIYTHPARIED